MVLRDSCDDKEQSMQQIHQILTKCVIRTKQAMPALKRRREQNSGDFASPTEDPELEKPLRALRDLPSRKNLNKYEAMSDPTERAKAALLDAKRHTSDVDYRQKRTALLADEEATSWQAPARKTASDAEKKAQAIVFKVREDERLDPKLFGEVPSEAVPEPSVRDNGGRFLVNKERIDRSRLFDIARHAPKGTHLHLHFNSEVKADILFPHARKLEKTMFVRTTRPLLERKDYDVTEIVFNVLRQETPDADIFSPAYKPDFRNTDNNPWMRWAEFRKRFPSDIEPEEPTAGLDNAEQWAREKMVITNSTAYHDRQTHNGAWACFNQGTRAFKGLVNYESVYRWYIGAAIDNMITEKVMYAELRPMLLDKSIPSDDNTRQLDHKAQMQIIVDEVRRKQAELDAKGELDKFPFGVKVIYCTPRSIPRAMMERELEDCIKLKLQFPDLICGFDLVGAEDRPNNISFYADLLLAFVETCKTLKISIPFMFHAGETLIDTGGSSDPNNSNLYDALLLNSKRIGHGYALLKHPMLIQKYKDANIALELCPISNELLHLCGNAREHPFPSLLAAGLHCSLNADNPSLFRSTLSHEFYQVMVGDTRMTLHGWRQLVEWSIQHSCLSTSQQAIALKIMRREWEDFCNWIVMTYGEYAVHFKEPRSKI